MAMAEAQGTAATLAVQVAAPVEVMEAVPTST